MKASAIILAGGRSTRLGFDKQLIPAGSGFLLDRNIALLRQRFDEIILVSYSPELHEHRCCRVVSDRYEGCGPLAGIHAGLQAARNPVCHISACDMPWLSLPYIDYLMKSWERHPEAEALVTRFGEMLEPLNGLYASRIHTAVEALLDSGQRRITALLSTVNTVYVPEETARAYSPQWRMFANINTPSDLETFQTELMEEQKQCP